MCCAILELYRFELGVYHFKFKILGIKNKIQAFIPNPTVSKLSAFHVCRWFKNKLYERLKSRVTGVLNVQLLAKNLSAFSTSNTKLNTKWRFLNINLFHIILHLLMFDLGNLRFRPYIILNFYSLLVT